MFAWPNGDLLRGSGSRKLAARLDEMDPLLKTLTQDAVAWAKPDMDETLFAGRINKNMR
ncbi:hypothetical protein [Pseudomonas sp. TH31]|uniref:hypothetical protein n=1 Tax=Pseudomonas sp. TH31 TaxID=2796396 RepID=UPI00191224C7|nr:hypothetical protein [Pseudomonas sp. TH31]MBK5413568.1 hypothetical protein [Pseudomonas sp. TH31]